MKEFRTSLIEGFYQSARGNDREARNKLKVCVGNVRQKVTEDAGEIIAVAGRSADPNVNYLDVSKKTFPLFKGFIDHFYDSIDTAPNLFDRMSTDESREAREDDGAGSEISSDEVLCQRFYKTILRSSGSSEKIYADHRKLLGNVIDRVDSPVNV